MSIHTGEKPFNCDLNVDYVLLRMAIWAVTCELFLTRGPSYDIAVDSGFHESDVWRNICALMLKKGVSRETVVDWRFQKVGGYAWTEMCALLLWRRSSDVSCMCSYSESTEWYMGIHLGEKPFKCELHTFNVWRFIMVTDTWEKNLHVCLMYDGFPKMEVWTCLCALVLVINPSNVTVVNSVFRKGIILCAFILVRFKFHVVILWIDIICKPIFGRSLWSVYS